MNWKRIVLVLFVVLVVGLAVGVTMTVGWRPIIGPKARPTSARTFERTPQRLERGRYLANSLTGCIDCHSPRDWSKHGSPLIGDKIGIGAQLQFGGLPGTVIAPNLTPDPETGAGNWSDDQL